MLATSVYGQQNGMGADDQYVTQIQGTEMARLPYAIDVLKQMPKLLVDKDGITVVGRGVPDIYVDNRRITELSELSLIPAGKVSSVKVISQPGAEYGKTVQAVVVITLVKEKVDGLTVAETFRLDLTHKLSANNEVSMGWKHGPLSVNALLAFNEERNTYEKKIFKYYYHDMQLEKADVITQHPDVYKQRWTGFLSASYAFNENNRLSVRYSLMNLRQNRTHIPETPQTNRVPETRHDIGVEFGGKLGAWQITVGNDMFFNKVDQKVYQTAKTDYYLRDEFDTRTYVRTATPLWKGSLQIGAEYEYDYMDVDKYPDDGKGNKDGQNYYREHSEHPDYTLAIFASTSQKFAGWTIEGGLRYEHRYSEYQPCEDDGLKTMLEEIRPYQKPEDFGDNEILKALFLDGQLTTKRDFLYPMLKVTTKWGKSEFALIHTQSSVKPNLGHTRLGLNEYEHLAERVLTTERVATTSLNWKYQWLELAATYVRYNDPICGTMDGSVTYNAPDYDAFNLNATVAPSVGIWNPVLNVNMHKQWFDMQLANGKTKLRDVLLNVNMNNRFVLPNNWLVLVGAKWHSKGGERNYYQYKPDFSLNASIQKEFPRQRLTLILSATNILKDSYTDVTRYTQAYRQISEGMRQQIPRTVSLTCNVKL